MKKLSFIGTLLLMGVANNSVANCIDDNYLTAGVAADVSGKQIMAVAPDGETWNEDHCLSGDLYKLGAGTAVDPYAFRGTWSYSDSDGQVTYDYTVGGSSSYTWSLWKNSDGDLCWEDSGTIIATAPAPGSSGSCGAGTF